jgi:tRNA-dihydrouridine synthase C
MVPLFLAPMEGVGAAPFRRAIATIGGFDEACTEFIRVSKNAHIPSLLKHYNPNDTTPIPQAAQIMGSDPEMMAEMCRHLERLGAPRIDLNCGCPSKTVNGKGAGASLLKTPDHLSQVASAMAKAVSIPVTVKLRSGFADTSLFTENILAAAESGAAFLTLHPRTKLEGYKPPANWSLIAKAKEISPIPVIGNGDILTANDAHRMLKETSCDGLMIGRGAIINPWIFHEIKASFDLQASSRCLDATIAYLRTFRNNLCKDAKPRSHVNQLKQIMNYLFQANPKIEEYRKPMLRDTYTCGDHFLEKVIPIYRRLWT